MINERRFKASVVIPTCGRPHRLRKCLVALEGEARAVGGIEVIVVEDSGGLETESVARKFSTSLPIRYIRQSRRKPAAARNRGAREASGEILVFLDDDCTPCKGWLETLLKPLDNPDVSAVGGRCVPERDTLMSRFLISRGILSVPPQEKGKVSYLLTGNMAIRKSVFTMLNGFDEAFPWGEDADFGERLRAGGIELLYLPEAKVTHDHPEKLGQLLRRFYRYGRGHVHFMRKAQVRDRLVGFCYLVLDWLKSFPLPLAALRGGQTEEDIFRWFDFLRKAAALSGMLREWKFLLRP